MSEMIDRVALAIVDVVLSHHDPEPEVLARAAIKAMREPTEKMVEEGLNVLDIECINRGQPDLDDAWRAMIDIALRNSSQPAAQRSAQPPQSTSAAVRRLAAR